MSPDSPTLEAATQDYADALRQLLSTLRAANAQFQLVANRSAALAEVLKDVGGVLRQQQPTDATEQALAMLSWVLRTGDDARVLLSAAISTHTHVLPRLSILQNVATDLSSAIRAASRPAEVEVAPPLPRHSFR